MDIAPICRPGEGISPPDEKPIVKLFDQAIHHGYMPW
jgi:hypothetical protein